MKKLFFVLAAAVVCSTSSFAAGNNPQNEKVMKAFEASFAGASRVSWKETKTEGVFHASFELAGEKLDAFFSEEGEVLATTRYISSKQLPLTITRQVATRYDGYTISPAVIEYSAQNETAYYITLIGEKNTLTVKADSAGDLSVFKKEKL